ncbi:hypothetical protein L873DRAFT_1845780 [Choiromyces venosus 120613-1]|uniref:Uncharacterized protein n=1 Tax=Choiromyces venosus 120613-1 TaxID=1336337 RepID=A0A3N4JHG2_9PEZI|nr:hypothetical protein L873DRAFT_1845780 [Choiromyces venosus 120613-1]
MFTPKGKHAQAADYGVENKQTPESPTETRHHSGPPRYNTPIQSSSTWFEQVSEKSSKSEDSVASPNSQDSESGVSDNLEIPVELAQKHKRLRGTALHESLCPFSTSTKYNNGGLRKNNSKSKNQSNGNAEETAYNNNFDFPAEEPRKIYLAPDLYAKYLVNRKRGVKLKRRQKLVKEVKSWEQRRRHERGPRVGRSDEFHTLEESQYAEGIVRAARRHRLETYHRERHEMWGLRPIQNPGIQEAMETSGNEDDSMDSGEGQQTNATSTNKKDVTDDATIEEILQGIPSPSDPYFDTPADIIFLPRASQFTAAVYSLEYRLGYTSKQVRWLFGGEREGRGPVPTPNGLGMRLVRYMKKHGLQDFAKVPLAGKGKGKAVASKDEEDFIGTRPLLPHGPRIQRKEFGVHGWYYNHPHEYEGALEYHHCY